MLGPALALVAVQWQLNKIGKAVERNIEFTRVNIELTQAVLDELREGAWYELEAVARVVLDEVRAAQVVGEVTDVMWDHLQSQSTLPILLKHRQRNLDALEWKLEPLAAGTHGPDWYEKHVVAVLRHSQAVMTAQQAISLYHLMRAANVHRNDGTQNAALREHLLTRTRIEHEQVAGRVNESLRLLHRSLAIWYEADPGKRLKGLGDKDVSLLELRDAVGDLHARAVDGPFRHLPPIGAPRTTAARACVQVADTERPAIEQKLRWVLTEDESLLLLARGIYRFGDAEKRYLLAVTERRAFLVDSKDLRSGRATLVHLPTTGEMTRTLKDGHEWVELHHDGRSGLLQTRAADSVVYNALTDLRSRLTAGRNVPAVQEDAQLRPGAAR